MRFLRGKSPPSRNVFSFSEIHKPPLDTGIIDNQGDTGGHFSPPALIKEQG